MYTLLLLVVLLTLFLEPAVAASPIMEYTLPGAPLDSYVEPDGMLASFCEHCVLPFYGCMCMHQAPYVAARNVSEIVDMPAPAYNPTETLRPLFAFVTADADRQPLINENIQYMNADETKMQPATVQAHIEDIYTPGDRLQSRPSVARKTPHKRQAPRPGGYPCTVKGCERTFDRACELNRHQKTHLNRSERPHKCSSCSEGFLYPKDLMRHQRKHIEQPSAQVTFYCPYPGCGNLEGFSRRDNLLRHQRKQHLPIIAAA